MIVSIRSQICAKVYFCHPFRTYTSNDVRTPHTYSHTHTHSHNHINSDTNLDTHTWIHTHTNKVSMDSPPLNFHFMKPRHQ